MCGRGSTRRRSRRIRVRLRRHAIEGSENRGAPTPSIAHPERALYRAARSHAPVQGAHHPRGDSGTVRSREAGYANAVDHSVAPSQRPKPLQWHALSHYWIGKSPPDSRRFAPKNRNAFRLTISTSARITGSSFSRLRTAFRRVSWVRKQVDRGVARKSSPASPGSRCLSCSPGTSAISPITTPPTAQFRDRASDRARLDGRAKKNRSADQENTYAGNR
jgi:hypothetical protein